MKHFETRVQELKYKVLKEIAKGLFNDTLTEDYPFIPERIVPGPKPTMRCCIYKERAIVFERMKLAMGGHKEVDNVVEVLKVACEECPLGGYEVTNRCRGCIAHRCAEACHRNAIYFDVHTHTAVIDKSLCVNCGMCAKACQYTAIQNYIRPCVAACKVKAISMDEDQAATINDEKCVQCGACVYQCPFGAIMDKSFIKDAIKIIKDSDFSKKYPVYAIVAPSIASQLKEVSIGKVVSALHELGFAHVVEAALGADMVSYAEAKELAEKGFLTSSCCPTFVNYIKKNYPQFTDNISHNLSPMATIAKWIKEHHPECKIVFIGPCISKKKEIMDERVAPYVDVTLTFEELHALIDAREINVENLEEGELDNASYYGRIFARAGGLTDAVKEALKEQGSDFEAKPISVDGLDNCRVALIKAKSPNREFNFIEGMGCAGGCIGGPCSLTHEVRDKSEVDKYGSQASRKTIVDAIAPLNDKA
ncbi:MAG: 4Fe-4S dicluster domain-containing protein [Bacilli bacterium]|nr:4Fe-4S dicluster domain-containing protein [Bacilli bacterium]